MSEIEKWRVIPSFPGYAASTHGRIKNRKSGKLLNPWPDYKGYARVGVYEGKKTSLRFVHALVLDAFVGPRPDGKQSRHLNGDRKDNRPSNLAYGTAMQNAHDKYNHGTVQFGEDNPQSVLTHEQVEYIRRAYKPYDRKRGGSALSKELGVHLNTVRNVIHGRLWNITAPEGG